MTIGRLQKLLDNTPLAQADDQTLLDALMRLVAQESAHANSQPTPNRKLYYISAEFLLGRLLGNNLMNLGLYEEVQTELAHAGHSLADIEECEPEPSLGNGGLGRLAACFLDSIASLGLPGDGIGLCYHYGLFKQQFRDNKQTEAPDTWIGKPSWLVRQPLTFRVPYGRFSVQAELYDVDVIGAGGHVNRLHLFDSVRVDESLVEEGISFDKTDVRHNLTLFLYPDDSDRDGRLLRIYQQYFMVSCAAQYILWELSQNGHSAKDLNKHVVIQINDTHPSMMIPELCRLLMEQGISFESAAKIVSETCAYTNHTILAEALEKWPLDYLQTAVPHLVPIIRKLHRLAQKHHPEEPTTILDENGLVHMAHMDIHYGFHVNGVAQLHTQILMEHELNPFYRIYPEKFSNKTNGISLRRWLAHCNPALAGFLDETIGAGWRRDAMELQKLEAYAGDAGAQNRMLTVKAQNKSSLAAYIEKAESIKIDPESVFDIQIKRLHEYKRQQMNALWVIHQYKQIKAGNTPKRPVTVLFGAKAAPSYVLAKDIIHLILCLQRLVNSDPQVSKWMKVVMVENYNVSYAQRLIPACDLSEQISLASKEASGTGNMKLMANGAVTLGTLDGANVEISQLVGPENIYLFGKKSAEVLDLYAQKNYHSRAIYDADPLVEDLVDFIISKELLKIGDPENLCRLYKELLVKDWFMTLLDLREYIAAKDKALKDYEDRPNWAKKMLINTAGAGFFSSDRTIRQYDEDIWHLK